VKVQLTVQKIDHENIFMDRVRINRRYRGGTKEAELCKISTDVKSKIFEVMGYPDDPAPNIYMDERTRGEFNLVPGAIADFEIIPVGWFGLLKWACNHANPAQRVAAQLGVLGFVLGLLSLGLAIIALTK
jgi:hypothetical protein